MSRSDGNLEATPELQLRAIAEDVSSVGRRVEQVRLQMKAAQRDAARSFEQSADCHDRTATSYERLAEARQCGADYREHAARHREFAREDRQLAARLRQMADG
jgi:hypothetical protein